MVDTAFGWSTYVVGVAGGVMIFFDTHSAGILAICAIITMIANIVHKFRIKRN